MATKKRVVTLRLKLDKKPEDLKVGLLKDWNKNAKRLDGKVTKRLGEGISYVAMVEGEPITLEADPLQKAFDNSQGPLVIVITKETTKCITIVLHFGKVQVSHDIPTKKVETHGALFKELTSLAMSTFKVDQFKMVSRLEESVLEDGDDLEAAMEELEGDEFHIDVLVRIVFVRPHYPRALR